MVTTAKTKKGNFNVVAEISVNPVTNCTSEKLIIEIEGKKMPVYLHPQKDRIRISDEVAAWFGAKNNSNIFLRCDTSGIYAEKERLRREAEAKRYDGRMIDSGCGFAMRNTKQNAMIIAKYGFDAIERIK